MHDSTGGAGAGVYQRGRGSLEIRNGKSLPSTMPYSENTFDDLAYALVDRIQIDRFLDIGAGNGKYGKLIKLLHPHSLRTAVEIERDYIERFALDTVYGEVLHMDATHLIEARLEDTYDLAILGDCLEHMRKSVGVDLLSFLVYRVRYALIIFPERYLQGPWLGYRSEAHISSWSAHDFAGFDHMLLRRGTTVAVCINGYQLSAPGQRVEELLRDFVVPAEL